MEVCQGFSEALPARVRLVLRRGASWLYRPAGEDLRFRTAADVAAVVDGANEVTAPKETLEASIRNFHARTSTSEVVNNSGLPPVVVISISR